MLAVRPPRPPLLLIALPCAGVQAKKGKVTNTLNYHLQRISRMIRR